MYNYDAAVKDKKMKNGMNKEISLESSIAPVWAQWTGQKTMKSLRTPHTAPIMLPAHSAVYLLIFV